METIVPRKQWATPQDWVAHKQTITRLYQDRELDEVMEIMQRDYGFRSTKKIYKTKIKEWDVGKRLNDEDVLAILHLRAQREAVMKPSEFWILGKRVSEANIARYLKRKPELVARHRRGYRPPSHGGSARLVCVTPPPPPVPVWRLPPGTAIAETEGLLVDCRDYFRCSWERGDWRVEGDGMVVGAKAGRRGAEIADDVLSKFYTAADLLYRSNFPGAFKVLDLAFRETGQMVSLNVPVLLSLLLMVFDRLARRGQQDTLNILRKYVQSQAAAVGDGGNRKLPSVLKRVSALEVDKYDDVFPRVYDLMIEQSDTIFGRGGNLSLEIYWHMFGSFVLRRDAAGQVRSLKRELDKIAPDAGPHPWVLRHRRLYAWKISQMKREAGLFDEAQEALRTVEHTYADVSQSLDASRHWGFAAMVEVKRGDSEAAEKYFRLSVKTAMDTTDEDAVQFSIFKLTEVLDNMGRRKEAEKMREYARNRIAEMTAQVQWDWDEFQARTAVEPITIPSPEDEGIGLST